MTTHSKLSWALHDSWVLTWRSVMHLLRHMDQLLGALFMPVMFLILFRFVFGGAIDTGDTTYANYIVAGILVQNLAFGATTTAINVVVDLQKGVVDRFRSLPMSNAAFLTGHVVADLVRNTLAGVVLLIVSFFVGFRPTATAQEWLLVLGLMLLFTFALSWLSAILGLMVKSMEAVQWMTFVTVMPLTFASSAFVPTANMPHYLRIFAENQPVTLVVNALRAWLVGTPIGNAGWAATIWCLVIIAVSVPVASMMFRRHTPK